MKRAEWKTFYGELRKAARKRKPQTVEIATFDHGGTYWQARYVLETYARNNPHGRNVSSDRSPGLTCNQRIIRDRSPRSRHSDAMAWCARYRYSARYAWSQGERERAYLAARYCINDARDIRLNASRFWEIAA